MKAVSKALLATALVTMASSCNSFLDVNTNPNSATGVTPPQLLANALVRTAANYTNYNTYSSFAGGYWTKSNAVSGYTEEQTYGYSVTYQQGLWTGVYDNLEDYEQIRTNSVATSFPNHVAIARIMKAYGFLLLVDQYGDIPYSQALKGSAITTPQFDPAESIYKSLVDELKGAVDDINKSTSFAKPGVEDVVYAGNMTQWKRFANSLRLRILMRMSSTSDGTRNKYVQDELTLLQTGPLAAGGDGLITADVLVQPTYAANADQQNPFYNTYGFLVGVTSPTSTYSFIVPTKYYVNLTVNNSDSRITQEYRPVGASTTSGGRYVGGNLGEPTAVQLSPLTGSLLQAALPGTPPPAGTFAGTFLRSPGQPVILMLSAESLFLRSEAELRGLLSGGDAAAKADYLAGIQASFTTTFRNSPSVATTINNGVINATTNYNNYITANTTSANGLVIWEAETTPATDQYGTLTPTAPRRTVTKLEKIITQKWIAEAVFSSTEGWDDYRRLSLPAIPVSIRAERKQFPARLYYPQIEINTNRANVPLTTTQYDRIFWDPA